MIKKIALALIFITLNFLSFSQASTSEREASPHTGDEISYIKYVQSQINIKAIQDDMAKGHQGIFFVEFQVETSGDLTGFEVSGSIGPQFDAELLRILHESPKWNPALREGKVVKQPMSFLITITY